MIKRFYEVVTYSVRVVSYLPNFTIVFLCWGIHVTVRMIQIRRSQDFRELRLKENLIWNTLTDATLTEPRKGDIPNRCQIHP